MRADRATLIYDGECGFCRASADLVRRWDRAHRLTLIPFQDQARVAAFGIPLPALAAAMHLMLPDGRVFAGADAAPEILRLLPGKQWLGWAFQVPGVLPVARRVYAWIARRRRCLVRGYAVADSRSSPVALSHPTRDPVANQLERH
ncbi:MAG: thiol-disulfide oxidoreductase DCC family protein [Gemmatimonadales bacterium]